MRWERFLDAFMWVFTPLGKLTEWVQKRWGAKGEVILLLANLAILVGVMSYATITQSIKPSNLDKNLESSLQQLQNDSSNTLRLIAELQSNIEQRRLAVRQAEDELKRLREQKTALELTPEQLHAIQSLVRRQPTAREIFTSLDFWVGRVAVSAFFFLLGILTGQWVRHRGSTRLAEAERT